MKDTPNVTVVPCALTLEGQPWIASIEPDFTQPSVGPRTITMSVEEALKKFGRPGLIKLDIEGGEYEVLKSPALIGLTLLVEWHREVPKELAHWNLQTLDAVHSLLTPK